MFDMLDDDDIDLGYVPSAPGSRSRASTMKKMTKKEPKPSNPSKNNTKLNEFDDLLDDLLQKEAKAVGTLENKSNIKQAKTKKDSFDFGFDDARPSSPPKGTKLTLTQEIPQNTFGKSKPFKGDQSEEIISQDIGFGRNFSKPSAFNSNTSKVQIEEAPIFTSTRNMKPPLKKKESQGSINPPATFGGNSPGLTIPEEVNLTLSSNKNDDEIIRPPPRLMGRRPSVDSKQQKQQDIKLSTSNLRSQSLTLPPEKKETKKQETTSRNAGRGLFLSFDEPKVQPKEEKKASFSIDKDTRPEPAKPKELKLFEREIKSLQKPKEELRLDPPPKAGLDLKVDQSVTWKETPPPSSITAKPHPQDLQKQLEGMRRTYQKQIDFLQENLQKQIAANRETRQKITQESTKMIDDERARSKKLYEEELARQREMFEWEKKRIQENYQSEIDSLRQSLEGANRNVHISTYQNSRASREEVEYLQLQLKNQKKILEDRERIIDRREMELEQREAEFSKRRKGEEERFRHEERRLIEMEAQIKKQLLDDKKSLAEQKQQMAIELANLEMEAVRKKERADYSLKENRLAREGVEQERAELRLANAELMANYRAKCKELEEEKERIGRIEQELLTKLRIVELKGKQASGVNKTMCERKENNWVDQKSHVQGQVRAMSVQKRNYNQKSAIEMNKTKDRFQQLQTHARDRLNASAKQSKRFDLDKYMLTVQNYNKLKRHA